MSSLESVIERLYPRYFVHGTSLEGKPGWEEVDVSTDDDDDFVCEVQVTYAAKLIADRNKVIDALCKVARALNDADPAAFDRIFYGTDVPPDETVQLDATDERWLRAGGN